MFNLFDLIPSIKTEFVENTGGVHAGSTASDTSTLLEAINVHVQWKHRLMDYLYGVGTEVLEHSTVCRDDSCPLGQWIYGSGARQYGESGSFKQLQTNHADFHRCAGEVVSLVQSGKRAHAEVLLNGEYTRISKTVVTDILRINTEFHPH